MFAIDTAWMALLCAVIVEAVRQFQRYIENRFDRMDHHVSRFIQSGKRKESPRLQDLKFNLDEIQETIRLSLRDQELDRIIEEDDRKYGRPSDIDRRS